MYALGLLGGNQGGTSSLPPPAAATSRLGFYPGYASLASFRGLESWLGHPAAYVVQFGDIRESAFTSSIWGEVVRAGALQTISQQVTLVESIPLAFGGIINASTAAGRETARGGLQATASGAHDANYRIAATYLRNGGYSDAIIRLGWEFDGDWMPWSARGNEALWIEAYRHVVGIFRSVSPSFRFDWNGTAGSIRGAASAYPGDGYVDIIGLDVYDKGLGVAWNPATQAWSDPASAFNVLSGSLQYQRSLATAHGKPVSYPEWALTGVSATARSAVGGDDPVFIQGMSDWMNGLPASGAASLAYQSYFNEDTADGRHRIDAHYFPNAEQRYRTLFGAAASPSTTKVVTRVTLPPKGTPRPTISIATTSNPVQGQPVVLTSKATSPNIAASAFSGKVTFVDGWSALGESVVKSGVGTLTTKALSPGRHWIWALYWANTRVKPVVSPLAVRTVSRASTALHAP